MFLQIFDGTEKLSEIELGGEPATIGRSPECTVILSDENILPKHAVLESRGTHYFILDPFGSAEILLNGRPVESERLNDCDSIQIGRYTLQVKEKDTLPMDKLSATQGIQKNRDCSPSGDNAPSKEGKAGPSGSLEKLSALARELSALDRPEAFIDRILETVLEELNADRASIFLNGPEALESSGGTAALTPVAVRNRSSGMGKPSSALCAPLSQGREVHGVIYIERGTGRPPFEESESRFLNTIATISGIGITNARTLARSLCEKSRLDERRRNVMEKFAKSLHSMLSSLEGELPLFRPLIPEDSFEVEVLENIERNAKEFCQLTGRFLAFAELEKRSPPNSGRYELIAPGPLVRKAIGAASEEARSRRILISDRLADWIPQVAADADRLQHALSSIVRNMVRLSTEGAILTIQCGGEGNDFQLHFSSDEAPALQAADMNTGPASPGLFDRFAAQKFPALGLDLEIARQILQEHGGDLRVSTLDRVHVRGGASISIQLPVRTPEQCTAPYEAAASATAT